MDQNDEAGPSAESPVASATRRGFLGAAAAGLVAGAAATPAVAQRRIAQPDHPDNNPSDTGWSDQAGEMAMKIGSPFTVAAVGDIIEMQPFTRSPASEVQTLVKLLRGADVTVANMEATAVDWNTYRGPRGLNLGTSQVADDMAAMGINMVTKANNHTMDAGQPGLEQTFRQLERVGIVHSGAGRSLTEARAPVYYQSAKGRVGMVGVYANSDPGARGTGASDPDQGFGGGPGANTLHLRQYQGVTQDQMAQLRAIGASIEARRAEVEYPTPPDPSGAADRLSLFGTQFKLADKPGEYSYEMNRRDHQAIMDSIRSGKQASDFMIVQVHWHQNRFAFQHYSFDHFPADFEVAFAHDAIDNGADMVAAHGVHTLKGVEVYKGRPIFYGLSNYVFQTEIMPGPTPPGITLGEMNARRWAWLQTPANLETVLTTTQFDSGRLSEIRLYPVDLGRNRHGADMGTPRVPSPEVAQRILQSLQAFSQPFGTAIEVTDGVGIVKIPA